LGRAQLTAFGELKDDLAAQPGLQPRGAES
jgi:hypothetical protein